MLDPSKLPTWYWVFLFFALSTFGVTLLYLFAPSTDER